jgi:3-oxoacyl-[acyl-carrier-protein] synthase II
MRRVVVTGIGGISSLGSDWLAVRARLAEYRNAVRFMPDWTSYEGLNTALGAPITDFVVPAHYTRRQLRSMGRVSKLAVSATENALAQAGLLHNPLLQSGRAGVSYGSSAGSTDAVAEFGQMLINKSLDGLNATSYVRMMSHTAAVNIGVFFGLTGRVIPTSTACVAGSQGIGYAYEAIRYGKQDIMVAGGGEELCPTQAAVFDTLYATSTMNEHPEKTPRPYDRDRDGLVLGEGACTFVLEEYEHAKARGANIIAELVGFASNSDGSHVTRPSRVTMARCIADALLDANLDAAEVGYVSTHGTATDHGDIAESLATNEVLGGNVPVSSMKSYLGHTLGACGALEAWFAIEMMRDNWFAPTVNLDNVDSECGELDYIMGSGRELNCEYVMSNNFAFGGLNTSLIFRRVD